MYVKTHLARKMVIVGRSERESEKRKALEESLEWRSREGCEIHLFVIGVLLCMIWRQMGSRVVKQATKKEIIRRRRK